MTIDEAIAEERDNAKTQREIAEECFEEHIFDEKERIEHLRYANEYQQRAEWLELLKWYQQGMEDIPSESGVLPKDVYHAGYEKAIDDLIAKCENAKFAESDEIALSDIHTGVNSGLSMAIHFAEQLKAGGENVQKK